MKRCRNIHVSFLDQRILYDYLQSGAFEKDIKKAIKKGAESAKDIRKETKADTACRHCTKKFEKTVKDLLK